MKLKSYFSGTVEAAMALARKEMGDDALLINARPATAETRSLGAFEVVFGILPEGAAAPVAVNEPPAKASEANQINPNQIGSEVAELKREMARLSQSLRGTHMSAPAVSPEEQELRAEFLAAELDPALVERICQGASVSSLFTVDATLGRDGAGRSVAALIGPPGTGKTTTLIKLAARCGLGARRSVQIITADVFRIGAADQLRSLAAILGVGCTVVETPLALAQAIEEHAAKELILIDTPGLAAADMEDGADLARLFATRPDIDTHLVLPASLRSADLSAAIDRFQAFQPSKLLFTRLDETRTFGPIVNESARISLPVSFLTSGQQIPDDLEPATVERLSALVQSRSGLRLASVGAAA